MLLCATMLLSCSEEEVSVFGNIYGTITDSKSGEPVRNAEVIISPGNKTTVSGSDGHFEFRDLEAEQYKVSVEADGYEYNSRQVTVVPGKDVTCDFRLKAIEIIQNLTVSPTTLNFGTSQTEMSVTIVNKGTEETEWTVEIGNYSWLSANPKMGRIDASKSQTIVFTVKRELLTEEKSIVVNIAAFGNTYPVSVSCAPKQTHGELSVEPTSLDFGEDATELNLKIKNVGDDELNWTISDITVPCLSVSEISGNLDIGGNKIVKVKLDREKLTEDLSTTFIVSDGTKEKSVTVKAKKKILKGELSVEPTSLDFGKDVSEKTITIKNVGTASLKWTISNITAPLSVSVKEGELAVGASKVVQVKLDRESMTEDVTTSFVVSDGEQEKEVNVVAEKVIYVAQMEVLTTELDFGPQTTELPLTIKNSGNADLNWEIKNINNNCISVNTPKGTLAPNATFNVVVKLNRSNMPSPLNTSLTVTDGSNDIMVAIKAEKGRSLLSLSTTKLDFGEAETIMTFDITNQSNATANLRWKINEAYHDWLTVSPTSGELSPNSSKSITVMLDRSAMTSDFETEIEIFDIGEEKSYSVNVIATKSSPIYSVSVREGLYAYYTFEDNFEDLTENEVHGYGMNSPTFVTGVKSDSKAAKFSRTKNSSFVVPEGLFDTRDKTISFWGKDFEDGVIFYVVSSVRNEVMFSLSMSDGALKFVGRRYMNYYQYDNAPSFSHPTINDGNWHHIVLTSDFNKTSFSTTTTTLYIDGMKVDTITEDGNIYDEAESEMASYNTGIKFVFGGSVKLNKSLTLNGTNMSVDNLRIYDTRRLDADEVKTIYKSKE